MSPPRNEPPSGLELKINQNNREIQGLAVRVEGLDQHLVSLTQKIEAVTDQVGLFMEGLTRLTNLIEKQEGKLDRILDAIQGQNKVAEAQASNVAALTRLVEMLVSRN
jgi:archaellum component FlaC